MAALCRCKPSDFYQCHPSYLHSDARRSSRHAIRERVVHISMGLCCSKKPATSRRISVSDDLVITHRRCYVRCAWSARATSFIIEADCSCKFPFSYAVFLQDGSPRNQSSSLYDLSPLFLYDKRTHRATIVALPVTSCLSCERVRLLSHQCTETIPSVSLGGFPDSLVGGKRVGDIHGVVMAKCGQPVLCSLD